MIKFQRAMALLINPPIYDFALYDLYLKPYGLLRLAGMLQQSGWTTKTINALNYNDSQTIASMGQVKRKNNGTGKLHRTNVPLPNKLYGIKRHFARYGITTQSFTEKLKAQKPDAIFITSGMTYWYTGVQETVKLAKTIHPKVPVIVGGIYATLMPEHCKKNCKPDYICTSTTNNKLNNYLKEKGLPGIKQNNNSLPIDAPCWSQSAIIRLNQGCPFNCEYCASSKINPEFIPGAPEEALNWMIKIAETRNTKNFAFYDDALLVNSEKILKPFLRQTIEYKTKSGKELNFYTPNALHIKYIDQETANLMKTAGFKDIRLGFESELSSFHKEYDNKYSQTNFNKAISYLLKAGFTKQEITVYILAGLPEQTAKQVEETIKHVLPLGINLSISEFSTVPGSALWKKCIQKSQYPIAEEPLYHNNSFFPMEWSHFTRKDMQNLKMLSKRRTQP